MDQINETDQTNQIASRSWYVIQTKPTDEVRVKTNLSNQEIEVFLPLFKSLQYSHGKMVEKIQPLFPNYLFARLDLDPHYYRVRWTRGVSKILGCGVEPTPLSEKVVEAIRERVGHDNLIKMEEEWREGDLVQIRSGPFKDLIGVFEKKMSGDGRVRILLGLIGVDVPVQISKWQIQKVA